MQTWFLLSEVVRVYIQIAAHFRQKVATNFLFSVFQGREFVANVQPSRLPLPLSLTKLQAKFRLPARRFISRSNSAPFTDCDCRTYVSECQVAFASPGE